MAWKDLLDNGERSLNLADRIRLRTIALVLFGGFSVALSWYVFEHRETAIPAILQNTQFIYFSGGSITLAALAWVAAWLVDRGDRQKKEVIDLLNERLREVQTSRDREHDEHVLERKALMEKISDIQQKHEQCETDLSQMKLIVRLNKHRLELPPNSEFGALT